MDTAQTVMPLSFASHSPVETRRLGNRIGKLCLAGDVIFLVGSLGAGKTCLTQGIARGLGIKEYATSSSFIIVREMYGRLPLYHMDLYRLEHSEEIADLGLDEYLYGNGVCVIEWAEKGIHLLPEEHLLIEISHISDKERTLTLKPVGERYEKIQAQMAGIISNMQSRHK